MTMTVNLRLGNPIDEAAKSRRAFLFPLPLGEGISGQSPKGKAIFDAVPRLLAASSLLPSPGWKNRTPQVWVWDTLGGAAVSSKDGIGA